MLAGWGIPMTKPLQNLIKRMASQGAGSAQVVAALRKTKDYAAVFPGIMRRDGTLRMSEAQYIAGYQSAKDFAASTGRPLSKGMYGYALKKGNSPSEMRDKIQAVDLYKENKEVYDEFNQYEVALGRIKKPMDRNEMMKFIMKQGPKEFEQDWQTAYTASQIEKYAGLGVDIGKGDKNDIGYQGLQKLLKQAPPGTDPTKIDWSDTARLAAASQPASRLYGLGITDKDYLKVALGTPDAVKIESRIKLAQATAEGAAQDRANPQLNQGGMQTGREKQQATE